ncbi:DUF305 domain-containing protein [Marinicauda algicola]|uniref:DUF305 domain-containing protein n=1 Tax=Marinicauda algicola TaxID=2029849 RepID=A0A4S2H3Z5_9PROT|nr:DUF305 domain-containing protein [Marinicauda algicola]TGY90002.1 DUF305 domain-containing protein [Marinicauda algicola]
MTYRRFALMILTSTIVMFVLMYLNTYAIEHVFFSETRTYMAILMGASMAVIMMGYMFSMYPNGKINAAIIAAGVVVFALSLWLVRSQVTVGGPSYMRAMIPHHSIAVLTSERANIEDARAAKLAREIIDAQNKEIAEMRYLIADIASGNMVREIYRDPPAEVGTLDQALSRVSIAALDPSPLTREEAGEVVEGADLCNFRRTRSADPILWWTPDGTQAVTKLNGVIIPLESEGTSAAGRAAFGASGMAMSVEEIEGGRANASLEFRLERGLHVGYHGFMACG